MLTTTPCHIPFHKKIWSKHASAGIPEENFVLKGKLCATLMENTWILFTICFLFVNKVASHFARTQKHEESQLDIFDF